MAQEAIALGFLISLAGPLTFLNARRPAEIARALPLEHLVIETDAPFLSPHPFRGQRNEPARVRLVAQRLAEVRGVSLAEVAQVTTQNAQRLFRWEDELADSR
jgi:TatD DNase family protein